MALAAQHVSELQPRRNAQSAQAARERLQGAVLPPGLVIDEGVRLSALWRLSEPLADLARAQRLLTVLCRAFAGDSSLVEPGTAQIALPGSVASSILPRFEVSAELWSPDTIRVDAIESTFRMDT